MLCIRLTRIGKTKQPHYRLIVLEKTKDPWGRCLEILGNYNPRSKEIKLEEERIKYWISKGAQPSITVHNLLIKHKVIEGQKVKKMKISVKRKIKLAEKKAASTLSAVVPATSAVLAI